MARMNTDHVSRLQLRHPRARMGYVGAMGCFMVTRAGHMGELFTKI